MRPLRWSWTAACAFVGLAAMTASLFVDGAPGATLLGSGIAVATLGVAFQIIGTWRAGHAH